jgi:hypothetical protein
VCLCFQEERNPEDGGQTLFRNVTTWLYIAEDSNYYNNLKREAARSFETSANISHTTWHHTREDNTTMRTSYFATTMITNSGALVRQWTIPTGRPPLVGEVSTNFVALVAHCDRLCGPVVTVPGYRSRGPAFDSRRYQIFWKVVSLERGPLSLVGIIEEPPERTVAAPV